jgi:creatinine amidohydrolase/Fe(II)-dependent formamide hydrolase-like protein
VLAHQQAARTAIERKRKRPSASSAASESVFNSARTTGIRALSILHSHVGEWIVCECCAAYLPVQKTVDQTRAIPDYVERPRQGSILEEPLP